MVKIVYALSGLGIISAGASSSEQLLKAVNRHKTAIEYNKRT